MSHNTVSHVYVGIWAANLPTLYTKKFYLSACFPELIILYF